MYAGRTRLLHLVPAMFLGFASFFATYFGGFDRAPGHVWAAWLSVIAMNALGPVFAVVATWLDPKASTTPAQETANAQV